jgi:hypothetical protein
VPYASAASIDIPSHWIGHTFGNQPIAPSMTMPIVRVDITFSYKLIALYASRPAAARG